MDWSNFIPEIWHGSLGLMKQLAIVIFPLFIIIEITEKIGLLQKISNLFKKVLSVFNLPKEASLPIIIGQTFGLVFGAGLLLRCTADDILKPDELMSISILFAICHAVFEDTFLFVAIGGNGFIILGSRIILALIITFIFGKYRKYRGKISYQENWKGDLN